MATNKQQPNMPATLVTGYDSGGNPFSMPNIEPTVEAQAIANPSPQVKLPQPKVATAPSQFVERLEPTIKQGEQGLIRAETEEARKRDDVLGRLMGMDQTSSQSIYNSAFSKAGGDDFLKQFTDANTKLAQLTGKFRTAKQAVSSATGQSQVFEGAQLNEVSRQEAVEVGNQAILVQAMQGNLNTARQIALDTVNFAMEDRRIELQNLMASFDALNGIVQGQEAQLLEQRRFELETELRDLDYTRDLSLSAISSGLATAEEMQKLTSLNIPNSAKQMLAQNILGRAGREDRQIAMEDREFKKQLSLFDMDIQKRGLALQERELAFKEALSLQEAEGKIDEKKAEQTAAVEKTLNTLALVDSVIQHAGLGSSVGPLSRFLPSLNNLTGTNADFNATLDQLKNALTVENIGLMKGPLTDKDIEFLKNLSTKLNTKLNEKDFKAELDKIKSLLQNKVNNLGLTPDQAQFYYGINDEDIGEIDSIYGGSEGEDFFKVKGVQEKAPLMQPISQGKTPYLQTLGAITGIDGSKYWKWGLDVDLKKGDKVKSPVNGQIIAVLPGYNGGFGNQIKIKSDDGRELWLSHLDKLPPAKPGTRIRAGQVIALGGNSGKMYSNGNGDGSHLDITMPDGKGGYLTARQVKAYLDKLYV